MSHSDPFLEIDRAHELAEEADEDFDKLLATVTKRHVEAIRTNCLIGNEQALTSIAEGLALRLSGDGVTELLVRTALAIGPVMVNRMLIDMIEKSIEDDAETAALVEIERRGVVA